MKTYTAKKISSLSDELGNIQAQIADLQTREEEIKADLTEVTGGYGITEGKLFRVNITTVEQKRPSWRAIALKAGASKQLIRANTSKASVTTVKVTSRRYEEEAS